MTLTLTCLYQNVRLNEMNTHAKYQVAICNRRKVMTNVKVARIHLQFDLWPWMMTLTLTYYHQNLRLNEINTRVNFLVDICNRWKVMTNVKVAYFDLQFDLWPWMMTLTFTFCPLKCAAWCDPYVCQISSCYLK